MLLGGALLTTVFVLLMSLTATFLAPLALILCQQVSENFSRAAIKGVLPDLVGTNQMARASSINGILSIGGPDDGATAGGPPASRPALSMETPAGSGSNPTTAAPPQYAWARPNPRLPAGPYSASSDEEARPAVPNRCGLRFQGFQLPIAGALISSATRRR